MESPNPFANKPELASTVGEPPVYVAQSMGDSGMIPYKNPKALIAYYLGILSGFPLIGLPLGIAAFVLGIQGLQNRKKDPKIKGSIHAWIGIGCGGFFALFWLLLCVGVAVAMFSAK